MGIYGSKGKRSSHYSDSYHVCPPCPNCSKQPNPDRFRFLRMERKGNYILAEVKYDNCSNYEGQKILIMQIKNDLELMNLRRLDPHFSKDGSPKILARFEPTEAGWKMGLMVFKTL